VILLIYLKIYETDNGKIITMCDQSLIDKVLEDENVCIDIKSYSDFYKGELVYVKDVPPIDELKDMDCANVIGEEAVDIAIKRLIINTNSIKFVNKIPYAQSFKMNG